MTRFLSLLALLVLGIPCLAQHPALERSNPSVLFCLPKGLDKRPYLDLDWLRDLHQAGFEPDYLEDHTEFTWQRIRRYNCLVVYGCPAAREGRRSFQFGEKGPRLQEYIDLIERYLEAGGGVFMMVHTDNADQHVRKLIEPWGARLPLEYYVEGDAAKIALMPRMRGYETLSLVDQVLPSPISAGVRQLWLPYGEHYNASWNGPIAVSEDWRVVVKGSKTSYTRPVDLNKSSIPAPPDALVRPGGVREPDLLAIRSYKKGRILLVCQQPVFSIGQGTQWLFDRRCLTKGLNGIPSDFERLIHNAFRWLSEPSLRSGAVGGYRATASRFEPPNYRPEVRKEFEAHFWSDAELDLHRPPREGTIFRGLIGVQSSLTAGKGTVAEFAAAAREAGLDFVIFMERFADLTPEKLQRLGEQCRRHSDDRLLLLPGYTIDTNVGNHMFFTGHDLPWPRPECLTGPGKTLLNIQYQDETGQYANRSVVLQWTLYDHQRYEKHMVGYYNFDDPRAMKVTDLKLCSAAAVRFHRGGRLVEDLTEDYLLSVEGTLPALPVAVSIVRSPQELIAEARSGNALTYAEGRSLSTLVKDALRWNSQYDGMNVFFSDGPIIRAWPACYRAVVYGAEPFVVDQELMLSELHVTSEVGLREIRIMNGRRLVRRFLPGGARDYRQILHLPGAVQQNLVLIAEDVRGGKAVSFARRCWKPGAMCVVFCGDHVNDCGRVYMARGIGIIQTHRFPEFPGGFTWDGGPKGVRPVVRLGSNHPHLISDLGREGGRAFNNIPILEFDDDQAIVTRSVLREVYDPKVPAVNPWHTFGPMGPSQLLESVRRYTEFNQPSKGVAPLGWAAYPVRSGAAVCNFSNTITFKKDQVVESLQLLNSNWYKHRPVMLVVGDDEPPREYNLAEESGQIRARVARGEWFGFYSPETYNNVLFINRADPIVVLVNITAELSFYVRVMADLEGKSVKAGERFHFELFSVNEPIDMEERGPKRFRRILEYLDAPEGMRVVSGKRQKTLGFFDVEAEGEDVPVELRVTRPAEPIGLTIPVRVSGLNPRWSAGLFQVRGHSTGYYTNGENVYTTLGFDFDHRVYAALYPDNSKLTHVIIGHPVVCDRKELFIEVMPRSKDGGGYRWHIAANNPTDEPVSARFRAAMDLPGLELPPRQYTIPAGGYLVLAQ